MQILSSAVCIRRSSALVLLTCWLIIGLTASAWAEPGRKALVIGIDQYRNVTPLQRAANDAQSVATTLSEIGFDVTLHQNIDRRALLGGISSFAATLVDGDEAVVFFAGHGVEMDGRNYLLAADVPALRSGEKAFLAGEGIAVDLVMDTIRARNVRVATYFFDACRDNPFADKGTRSLGSTRGLAGPPAVEGTFVIYSAAAGQTALDGLSETDPDPNSVFTRVLLPLLAQPGLSIRDLATSARQEVQRLAATAQHPQRLSYYDELIGDYVLNPAPADPGRSAAAVVAAPVLAPPEPAPLPDSPPKTRTDIIRATQAELLRIGCNAGMPDGVAGRQTATALRFYGMLKGWGDSLPGALGSDALLAALEVEPDRICASQWIALHAPMALSGDWDFSMQCPDNLGAQGSALLVVDQNGLVRGEVTNQSGQSRAVSGKITPDRFSGEIDGKGDVALAFDLPLSGYETKIEGINAFGCQQTFSR